MAWAGKEAEEGEREGEGAVGGDPSFVFGCRRDRY